MIEDKNPSYVEPVKYSWYYMKAGSTTILMKSKQH